MNNDELKVIVFAKRLAKHSMHMANNTNRFPKKLRFTLANPIQDTSNEIYKCLSRANNRDARSVKQLTERINYQTQAIDLCNDMLFYLELALEEHCIDKQSCEHWSRMVIDVKLLTISWKNSDMKRFNN